MRNSQLPTTESDADNGNAQAVPPAKMSMISTPHLKPFVDFLFVSVGLLHSLQTHLFQNPRGTTGIQKK